MSAANWGILTKNSKTKCETKSSSVFLAFFHRETKGRFRKSCGFGECALVPVFVPGEHANVPSFRFRCGGNVRMYPRFVPGEHLPNHPFGKPPFSEPPILPEST